MPGKHTVRPPGAAGATSTGPVADLLRSRRGRLAVGIGLAVALLFGVALWSVANRSDPAPPAFVLPPPASSAGPGVSILPELTESEPPTSPSAVAPTTREPTAEPTTARPATGVPSTPPSTAPSRRPTTSPAVTGDVEAQYVITDSDDDGFQVGVLLTNTGDAPESWTVRVVHDPDAGVRISFTFNARESTSGRTTEFSGGPLGAGDTTMFGFRARKRAGGVVRPSTCTVGGRACVVTVEESGRGYRNEFPARTR